MAFLLSVLLVACGKDEPATPTFEGDQLYQQMLGTHLWVSDYDPTYRYWVGTWAESYVRFTADSVVFYHLVQCSDWMTDSTWVETRRDAAHPYTFAAPDRYTIGGIQYLVQPSQLHPTCYTFWGDDQSGFEVEVERIEE